MLHFGIISYCYKIHNDVLQGCSTSANDENVIVSKIGFKKFNLTETKDRSREMQELL